VPFNTTALPPQQLMQSQLFYQRQMLLRTHQLRMSQMRRPQRQTTPPLTVKRTMPDPLLLVEVPDNIPLSVPAAKVVVDPVPSPPGKLDPIAKEDALAPFPFESTSEEQARWCETAFKRGLQAEYEGKHRFALICYEGAANNYPEAPVAIQARQAFEQLNRFLQSQSR
jgi:hypothetical protein